MRNAAVRDNPCQTNMLTEHKERDAKPTLGFPKKIAVINQQSEKEVRGG